MTLTSETPVIMAVTIKGLGQSQVLTHMPLFGVAMDAKKITAVNYIINLSSIGPIQSLLGRAIILDFRDPATGLLISPGQSQSSTVVS